MTKVEREMRKALIELRGADGMWVRLMDMPGVPIGAVRALSKFGHQVEHRSRATGDEFRLVVQAPPRCGKCQISLGGIHGSGCQLRGYEVREGHVAEWARF